MWWSVGYPMSQRLVQPSHPRTGSTVLIPALNDWSMMFYVRSLWKLTPSTPNWSPWTSGGFLSHRALGVPPVFIHFNGIFPHKTIQLWGVPLFMDPPIPLHSWRCSIYPSRNTCRCWALPAVSRMSFGVPSLCSSIVQIHQYVRKDSHQFQKQHLRHPRNA